MFDIICYVSLAVLSSLTIENLFFGVSVVRPSCWGRYDIHLFDRRSVFVGLLQQNLSVSVQFD